MFFLVRHGERADFSFNEKEKKRIKKDFDPPLTKLGEKQAYTTGKYIFKLSKNILGEERVPIIISSPFLRCIETAINLSKNFDKIFNNSIYLEDSLGEYMQRTWFSYNIIDDLSIKNSEFPEKIDKLQIINGFLNKTIIKDFRLLPEYPEDFIVFFKRIQKTINLIAEKYFKDFDEEKYFIIIVMHGYGIQVMLENYGALQKLEISEYCSITLLRYFPDLSHEVLISNSDSHLLPKL